MGLSAVLRDESSAPFFDGTAEGRLMLRHCPKCESWSEPGALLCANCHSRGLEWADSIGHGEVVSWTVITGRPHDGVAPPPEVIALVEMSEGPWVHMALVDHDGLGLTAGTSVVVEFAEVEGGEVMPVARLHTGRS
ncbi:MULTISPECIES: Zn-ribbon domain-containing OB-fold protein [Rhodococcus]|uniref:Zn-ribbon domain-containing OB-fold protein n=1 Tax=Rhodococcus globerulus TaxID=33008 RepID=UPI001C575D75|nr:OB-fold domain-containing protein [Rhodococcus globerulus]QXV99941.1 OB-fold domain-containing protein [Rhodococcus globerulus]